MPPIRSVGSNSKIENDIKNHTKKVISCSADHKTSTPTNLKAKLAITPKTVSLLQRCGYNDYQDLRHSSPNQVVAQLRELSGITASQAEIYKRPLRRMVWLATKDEPEKLAKVYQNWSQKALVARGWWVEGYDDMTGEQADRHISRVSNVED